MTAHADAIAKLRATIHGLVLEPDDADYDEARRVWNGMIDKRPALVVRAAEHRRCRHRSSRSRDETGPPLAIRGGGHNVAGNGTVDDGIVLDLGALNAVDGDPDARLVRVGAGRR